MEKFIEFVTTSWPWVAICAGGAWCLFLLYEKVLNLKKVRVEIEKQLLEIEKLRDERETANGVTTPTRYPNGNESLVPVVEGEPSVIKIKQEDPRKETRQNLRPSRPHSMIYKIVRFVKRGLIFVILLALGVAGMASFDISMKEFAVYETIVCLFWLLSEFSFTRLIQQRDELDELNRKTRATMADVIKRF